MRREKQSKLDDYAEQLEQWLGEEQMTLSEAQQRLETMGQAARRLSHPNAAREIAAMAARVAGIQFATD